MTQEDKQLLIQDICARLPYDVKLLHTPTNEITNLEMIGNGVIDGNIHDLIENFKPYLFPLESMTEEQKVIYGDLCYRVICNRKGLISLDVMEYVNWCYKNHIDINNLIPMGLANDSTGLNIY